MRSFHVFIHARASETTRGEVFVVEGRAFSTLHVPPPRTGRPLDVGFDGAAAALARLPRMFLEPDGSFVWVAAPEETGGWQIDGLLHDRGHRLDCLELKGSCPPARLDDILRALGWPQSAVMFQLAREAVFLDENEFRRLVFA